MAMEVSKFYVHKTLNPKLGEVSSSSNKDDALNNLYIENSLRYTSEGECLPLRRPTNLLQSYVKEKNCLVLKLHAPEKGYSLYFRFQQGEVHLISCPFMDVTVLAFINRGHLMPILQDILVRLHTQVKVFYGGCIFVEINDYRQLCESETRYVCLKPTTASTIQEAKIYASESKYSNNDLYLHNEARIVLKNSEPVCLNPDPVVSFVTNRIQYNNNIFADFFLKQKEQVSKSRKNTCGNFKSECYSVNNLLSRKRTSTEWFDFHNLHKSPRTESIFKLPKNEIKPVSNSFSQLMCHVPIPENHPLFQGYDLKGLPGEMYLKKNAREGYIVNLLSEDVTSSNDVTQRAEIIINKADVEEQYYGKVCITAPLNHRSTSSEFLLGSKRQVDNFIKKFCEVFTEECIKPAEKIYIAANGTETISYTEKAKMQELKPKMSSNFGNVQTLHQHET